MLYYFKLFPWLIDTRMHIIFAPMNSFIPQTKFEGQYVATFLYFEIGHFRNRTLTSGFLCMQKMKIHSVHGNKNTAPKYTMRNKTNLNN